MALLYRGVSDKMDRDSGGRLVPRGSVISGTAFHDGHVKYDGRSTHGETRENIVHAHRVRSKYRSPDGQSAYVSTSRNRDIALGFVGGKGGWLYVIDEALLEVHGVVAIELPDPVHPEQKEVSLAYGNGEPLPDGIVVAKERIAPSR